YHWLVNNVREHFMIYLALWLLLAVIDLIWLWFY
ncbi:TPA: YceO family protein, partial [Klebsiella aerogenes]|nr:YceO family protein [Klebsiella aerogenes]